MLDKKVTILVEGRVDLDLRIRFEETNVRLVNNLERREKIFKIFSNLKKCSLNFAIGSQSCRDNRDMYI